MPQTEKLFVACAVLSSFFLTNLRYIVVVVVVVVVKECEKDKRESH